MFFYLNYDITSSGLTEGPLGHVQAAVNSCGHGVDIAILLAFFRCEVDHIVPKLDTHFKLRQILKNRFMSLNSTVNEDIFIARHH